MTREERLKLGAIYEEAERREAHHARAVAEARAEAAVLRAVLEDLREAVWGEHDPAVWNDQIVAALATDAGRKALEEMELAKARREKSDESLVNMSADYEKVLEAARLAALTLSVCRKRIPEDDWPADFDWVLTTLRAAGVEP